MELNRSEHKYKNRKTQYSEDMYIYVCVCVCVCVV